MTKKYKVRDDYVVKKGKEEFHGGDIVELTDEEAQDCILRIEEFVESKPKKAKEKADE